MKKTILLITSLMLLLTAPVFSQNNFMDFSGTADHVSLGDLGAANDWTIEVWFHYTTLSNFENIFSTDDLGGNANLIRLETSASYFGGALYIIGNVGTQTVAPHAATSTYFSPGWHHIAIVGDQTNSKFYAYLDGIERVNISQASWPTTFHDFVIGRGFTSDPGRDFNGLIDDFRIWNVARSQADIVASMNTELNGNEAGLFAYYNFNQGTCGANNAGLSLTDSAPLGGTQNGTLNGFGALDGCSSNFVCAGPTCGFPAPPISGSSTAVPTLGQWGLIVLTLLLLSLGTVALRTRQRVLAGTSNSSSISFRELPFDKGLFGKILLPVALVVFMIFVLAVGLFGYEMTSSDVPGSLIAVPLLAYLLHLVGERGK